MIKLDSIDVKILQILQEDASPSTNDIAERLNLSQSPCWRRINRMQKAGLIQKTVSLISREAVGMDLVAFITVNLSHAGRRTMQSFEDAVSSLDEVMECYTMTGAWDYMLKIIVKDIRQYENFVRDKLLVKVPNIGEIHSHIAVTEIKNSTVLPLKSQI